MGENKFKMKTPVFITCYNRLWTLEKTLASLKACDSYADREIHFFCDNIKHKQDSGVYEVRQYIEKNKEGNWHLHFWKDENLGIKGMTLEAIKQMMNWHWTFIFIQDDMQFSKDFLLFMDWALDNYKNNPEIMIVSAYSHIEHTHCYTTLFSAEALGIWASKWDRMIGEEDYRAIVKDKSLMKDWTNKTAEFIPELLINSVRRRNDSFSAPLIYSLYKNNKLCLHPNRNKLRHLVSDSVNCKAKSIKVLNQNLFEGWIREIAHSEEAHSRLQQIYKRKLIKKFTRTIGKIIGI